MDFHTLKKFNKKAAGGKRFLNLLITEANRKKLNAFLKNRLKERMQRRAFEDRASHLKDLVRSSMRHITPVTQPLVLIIDLPLGGGTLLNQLFDGHPQIHVHPGEIKLEIDEQKKSLGPGPDPVKNPKKWFAHLTQNHVDMHLEKIHRNLEIIDSSQPFVFIPYLQKRIFLRYLKSVNSRDLRTVYNAYMTSYFGSWLNYANLTGLDKKYIVGLSKTHAMDREKVKQFFEIYPEGKLVSIIRAPENWIRATSALQVKNYADARSAVNQWRKSTESMIRSKEAFGSRVCIVRHEDLAVKREAVMRYLSNFLNIEFDGILLSPTFNRDRVKTLDYAQFAEDSNVNPLLQSDAAPIEETDANWNQTLAEYEAALSNTVLRV